MTRAPVMPVSTTAAEYDAAMAAAAERHARTCRYCGEAATDHCQACIACPEQECPYWCPDNDDPYGDA